MSAFYLSSRQRTRLEKQLQSTRDVRLYRRTLAVLEFARGRSVTEIARTLRVSRPSVYRWIERYRESSDAEALQDDERSGRPPAWTDDCAEWLRSFLKRSPAELGYFAANWTVPLLRDPLQMCTGQLFSDDTIRRALKQLDYVWKRPRYVLAPDPDREKKKSDSPQNSAVAAKWRVVGGRRNRFAAVPSAAGQLESTWATGSRVDFGLERTSGRFRRNESADRQTAVSAAPSGTARRLSRFLGTDRSPLPEVRCHDSLGCQSKPYGEEISTTGQGTADRATLAPQTGPRTQSYGLALGARQRHCQCQPAICEHRRSPQRLYRIPRVPHQLGSTLHRRSSFKRLLA
jgi:transposase